MQGVEQPVASRCPEAIASAPGRSRPWPSTTSITRWRSEKSCQPDLADQVMDAHVRSTSFVFLAPRLKQLKVAIFLKYHWSIRNRKTTLFRGIRIDFQSFKPSLLFCCDSKLSGSKVQMITNFPQSWPVQAFQWQSPRGQKGALNSSLLNRILGLSLYDARQHRRLEQKWLYAGADSLSLVDARKLDGSLLLLCAHAQPCGRETKPVRDLCMCVHLLLG